MKVMEVIEVMKARMLRIDRRLLAWAGQLLAFVTSITSASLAADFPDVVPGYAITFPADEGSHPTFRTEWWYVTGWLTDARGLERGFRLRSFAVDPAWTKAIPRGSRRRSCSLRMLRSAIRRVVAWCVPSGRHARVSVW